MKKLKSLILTLVLVFSVLFLGACMEGPLDSKASVDKSGTFTQVEQNSFQTEIKTSKAINESKVNGYKLSMESKSNSGDAKNVAIVKFDDNGVIKEAATKISLYYKMGDVSSKSNIEAYLKDDCWYISAKISGTGADINFKYKFSIEQTEQTEEYLESFYDTLDSLSVNEILKSNNEIVGSYTNGKFTYSKAVVNDITKYKLTLNAPAQMTTFGSEYVLEKFESYVLIKDGCLNGFESITKNKVTIAGLTTSAETHIGLTQYNGSINFPNFNGYTEAPAM